MTSAVNDLPRDLQRLRERKLRICGMVTTKVVGVRRKKFKKRMTFIVRLWWMLQETSYRGPACLRFRRELNYFDDDMDIASPHFDNFHLNSDTITSLKPKSSKRVHFAEECTTFIIPARGEEVLELFDVNPGPPNSTTSSNKPYLISSNSSRLLSQYRLPKVLSVRSRTSRFLFQRPRSRKNYSSSLARL